MNSKQAYRFLVVSILLLLGGGEGLLAQDTLAQWNNYTYVQQSNAWLTSNNASGLQHLPVQHVALAEAYANKGDGNFTNYYQSNDYYNLGAQTESYFRLDPKVVFYGKILYNNFTGKNMSGSAFINPYYNPFDIVEMVDSARGTKNLEKYYLVGAVSVNVWQGLNLGGKVNYTTANYAKHRDLRHVNKLLDLSLTLGPSYTFGSIAELGVNYFYRRSVESVRFGVYGTTDKPYSSLISFGSFYGRTEAFSTQGSGYTIAGGSGSSNPLFNKFQGGALQFSINIGKHLTFFNEGSFASRKGSFGKKTSSTPVYTEHNGSTFEYKGNLSYKTNSQLHTLEASIRNEELKNFENIYQKNNTAGGKTEYIYYGQNQVIDRKTTNLSATYTANLGVVDYHPTWVLTAGAYTWDNQQIVSLYPYYRRQIIQYTAGYIQAKRNFIYGKNQYGILLGALYGSGSGTAKKDGTYTTPSSSQGAPTSLDNDLYREYEYLTTPRLQGNAALEYTRLLTSQVQGYIKLGYEYTHANKVEYVQGNTFGLATLTIGCAF